MKIGGTGLGAALDEALEDSDVGGAVPDDGWKVEQVNRTLS